jgi:hypothetical protein
MVIVYNQMSANVMKAITWTQKVTAVCQTALRAVSMGTVHSLTHVLVVQDGEV